LVVRGCLFLKAAVYHGPNDIRIEEVSEPKVSARKVLVKFKAGSIRRCRPWTTLQRNR